MGIVAVVDLLVTATSIQVQVELHEPHIWQYTDIWCAAYPSRISDSDDPFNSMYNVHISATTNELHNMPPIHFDTNGDPIQPERPYWVKCHADEVHYGTVYHFFLHTIVTTHEPDGCHTGVHWITPTAVDEHLIAHGPIQDGAVDLGHTTYFDFPSGIRGLNVYDVPRPLPAGSELELTCCRGHECEFWVSMYVCTECTGPRDDGLRIDLLSNGWDAGSCSPRFDDNRQTISFHKHVNANAQTWTETLHSEYDEIAVVMGFEGCASSPWCSRRTGPPAGGDGTCYRNGDCPAPFGNNP
eukprot:TRINITY_DN710_c2_g2_i1.p1 TRINITY_DN710_c2_g2~~TRINITY_DN710_c2_g2_i1.p1  ORF type:complete len:320 (+),score=51.87 TRINITY_DN710_c2_g2_i1:67-960(+)